MERSFRIIGLDTFEKHDAMINWTKRELKEWSTQSLLKLNHNMFCEIQRDDIDTKIKNMMESVRSRIQAIISERMWEDYVRRKKKWEEEQEKRSQLRERYSKQVEVIVSEGSKTFRVSGRNGI